MTNAKRTGGTARNSREPRPFSDHARRSSPKSSRPRRNTNSIANAKKSHERYTALARAAASTGDAIDIENFYQHAEHYLRLARELEGVARLNQPNRSRAKDDAVHVVG